MKSKIAYSTDNWTTKQMVFTFAGTMASFINDEWEICERLVDFHHIEDKEHEGIYAAKAFIKTAASRGGLHKISSFLWSRKQFNCSNCTTLPSCLP